MGVLDQLKATSSLSDVAKLLEFSPSGLSYLLYKLPQEKKYSTFEIPKKSGGTRKILAPSDPIKNLQRRLLKILTECRLEIEAIHKPKRSLSHGFKKGHSIVTNARPHKNRRYVLNLDIEDFFPSINFGRVRGYFLKHNDFKLNTKTATIIAQIACHKLEPGLPQGSPCSPIIADLITHLLDVRLAQLAKKHKCTYSRYADDLTFSTNQKIFPSALAEPPDEPSGHWSLGDELVEEITGTGFSINHNKTRMQLRISRQLVTGLTVNRKVNIRASYYRGVRAMCASLFTKGAYYWPNDDAKASVSSMHRLEGALNHIDYIKTASNKFDQAKDKEKVVALKGFKKLLGEFLFFRNFINFDLRPQNWIVFG